MYFVIETDYLHVMGETVLGNNFKVVSEEKVPENNKGEITVMPSNGYHAYSILGHFKIKTK